MARVRIRFSSVLHDLTRERETELEGVSTVKSLFNTLVEKYGKEFSERVLDDTGRPRRFVNVYVNGKDIRHLKYIDTELNDGDEVSILPAVSGG
ncbi:MAG: MoaD family protein [Candidatus Hydrothermarchaeota archaeon]